MLAGSIYASQFYFGSGMNRIVNEVKLLPIFTLYFPFLFLPNQREMDDCDESYELRTKLHKREGKDMNFLFCQGLILKNQNESKVNNGEL